MTKGNFTRMFRSKLRTNTCRIVLLTSLVWLLIDVILLMHYADFLGGSVGKKTGEYDVEVCVVIVVIFKILYQLIFLTFKAILILFKMFFYIKL